MRQSVIAVALTACAATVALADPTPLEKLLARTDKVAREVSKIRGLPLKRPIPNEVVDKEELRKRLVAMASEEKTAAETAVEGIALARWGMIPLATDYKALLIDLLTEQIAGYYDPETKKLTISKSAGDDPAWAEMVLAHEIDHGLQDQSFDLKKFNDLPASEGDAATARHALVEGDGIALMIEVMLARTGNSAPWANPEVADSLEKAMTVPGNGDGLDNAPLAIRETMIFPYRSGLSFVAALRRRQPWSAVDAAYRKPPKSTEHILHPERYLAGDDPVPVEITQPASLRGFVRAHSTVWGELGWTLWLRSHGVPDSTATHAGAGWGGDRVVTFVKEDDRRPHRAVGISRSEWDSEADALEAFESAEKALDRAVAGATIDHVGTRTRWMALDGTVTWIDRKGPSMVIVHGAPAWAAESMAAEVWTASSIVTPVKPAKPAKK
ncbi:MAG: hypothetical protein H0T46_32450 [Deltaproteobacteria bacterium]|nr:hypothetical protein [Deltaproteobacteria bacterium]